MCNNSHLTKEIMYAKDWSQLGYCIKSDSIDHLILIFILFISDQNEVLCSLWGTGYDSGC